MPTPNVPVTHSDDKLHRRLLAQTINWLLGRVIEASTVQLIDIADPINTSADKVLGYQVLNTTTGVTVFASGATDGAVWEYYDSTTAHTPV